MAIQSVKIYNFKSIKKSDEIKLQALNILIGPNGAGKSNFISFFKFLNKLFEQQLQLYISQNGRADNFLYFGRKTSEMLFGQITFDTEYNNRYGFKLVPDQAGNLIFAEEWSSIFSGFTNFWDNKKINNPGAIESVLPNSDGFRDKYLKDSFSSMKIYHFHDTGFNSKIKQPCTTNDYSRLYEDGRNLAAFLYKLQKAHPLHFNLIEKIIRSIAPFFNKFHLEPDEIDASQIYLRWFEKGSDQVFNAHNFSDGTLRMICLTTLMMQPELPKTIIIDEPELGLHPVAIEKLASMIKTASTKSQIIVSTQSVTLLNHFNPEDVLVVERENNQTVIKRLSSENLQNWLSEYTLGELWNKNVFGGRP
ncbi:MAG: AAA family ATPase [Bacteroidetes bacterium]|nr:AAA family ATPase [Bacteroidota bacterium]